MTSTNLAAALVLARTGLPVFPVYEMADGVCTCRDPACQSPGKHPRIREGLYGATTEQGIIRGWWAKWPEANLAIATGQAGLVAIDIDPGHGGEESWRDLLVEMGTDIGETVTAITGSGGTHLLYYVPDGVDLRNTAGRLGPGIDTRAAGGYIVVAPSNHVSGNRYAWEEGYAPWDRAPSPLPAALLERLTRPAARGDDSVGDRPDIATLWQVPCPQGQRDNTLITLVGWARSHIPSRDVALAMLVDWDTNHCQPPLGEAVVREKVYRAWERWTGPARIEWGRLDADAPEPEHETFGANDRGGGAADEPETPTPPRPRRWELIDAVDYRNRPRPEWLVDGLAMVGSFGAGYGKPGGFKSTYFFDLACSIATGVPFFGRQVRADAGAVVYVVAEGASGMTLRLAAWEKARGVEIPRGRLFFLPAAVPFVDGPSVRDLIIDTRALGVDISLVVIDTLNRTLAGGDENSPEAMGAFITACGEVQKQLKCAVIGVHHGTKSDGSLRGHSSLPGALDWIVHLTVLGEGDTKIVRVEGEKQKDAEPLPLLELRPVIVELRDDDEPDEDDNPLIMRPPHRSVVLEPLSDEDRERQAAERKERVRSKREAKLAPVQRRISEALYWAHGEQWTTHDQWWKACRNIGMETTDRQAYRVARERLIELKFVEQNEADGEPIYRATPALATIIRTKPREGKQNDT